MDPFNDIVENEVLLALIEAGVDFIVVGGAAVQHYGLDRPRKDLDILLNPSEKNGTYIRA